jgi:hypothetical protein
MRFGLLAFRQATNIRQSVKAAAEAQPTKKSK